MNWARSTRTRTSTLVKTIVFLILVGVTLVSAQRAEAATDDITGSSVTATWNCTGTPCPWGTQESGQAAVWPAAAEPTRVRYGYTVSHDVYAPAAKVAGWKVTVTSGSATIYSGPVNGSHASVASLNAGQSFTLPNLTAGDIVSVQGGAPFEYSFTPGTSTPPSTPPDPGAGSSVLATFTCTGSPCPWGQTDSSNAAVWPAAAEPTRVRYGYTVSHDVYAPAAKVAGWKVTVTSGSATIYSGPVNGSHASVASLNAGQSFTLPNLTAGDIVSVQGGAPFGYTFTPGAPTPPPPSACIDPTSCDPVSWVSALWRYTGPNSNPGDWYGGVITWPSWSAYSTNNRTGDNSRAVYSESGEKLYPYMGAWADGCKVKVVTGHVLIIEWQRGTDEWREKNLVTGDTYTIDLVGSENGAMIETPNNAEPFTVSLSNCTPQRLDDATPVNTAPVAAAGAAQSVSTGSAVTLDGSGSRDADGNTLTYAWTQTGGPAVTLSSATAVKPTFTAPATVTTLTFSLVVNDGKVNSPASTTTVTTTAPNTVPVAAAGAAQSVSTGSAVTLDGSGSRDADGNTLTYAWTQTGGPAVTLSSATAVKPTFTAPATATTLTFSLVVNDGKVNSPASTTTVTTTAPNTVPVAAAGAAQSVSTGSAVTLDGSGSRDADGNTLTYAWTQTGGPAVTLSSATAVKPTFTAPATATTLTFSLVVNDGKVNSPASTTTVTTALPLTNLAASKTATQSSTEILFGAPASRAVDGNTNGVFSAGSVARTNSQSQPWWQVDLGAAATVSTVTLWNRTDCCSTVLANGTVFISSTDMNGKTYAALVADTTVKKLTFGSIGTSFALPAGDATGRYVRVQLPVTAVLSLAEVQVAGRIGAVNLSTGKAATQSSTDQGGIASRAVDGNTNGVFATGSVTLTTAQAQPWWQVDLGAASRVNSVVVSNRTDCCGTRLNNAVVFLSATDMTGRTYSQLQADATVTKLNLGSAPGVTTTLSAGGAAARYVRVQSPTTSNAVLSLAEVVVTGL